MSSAKDINDRLLRLELAMSNVADELIGLHALFIKVREDVNVLRSCTIVLEEVDDDDE